MKKYVSLIITLLAVATVLLYVFKHKPITNINTPSCKNCDVVIISLDTIRARELPCFGYTRNTMPNLCRFADQNIQFNQAYSQSSWTFPNATSVMTGLYPSEHKMYDNILSVLQPSTPSLPKLYKKAGYQTVAIINSQETNIPFPAELLKQFDTVISTRGLHLDQETQTWTNTFEKFSASKKPLFLYIYTTYVGYYRSTDLSLTNEFPLDPTFTPPNFVFEKKFTESMKKDAYALVEQLKQTTTDTSTQNLYTILGKNFAASASISQATQAFETLSDGQKLFLYQEEIARKLNPKNPSHLRYIQNLYDANLAKLDSYIAPLLTLIGDAKHSKNTLAIFYSDHGENIGDHESWGHATEPYSTLTHVPLIMHVPNTKPKIHKEIIQLIDLFPTLLSFSHIQLPPKTREVNILTETISSKKQSYPPFTIAQLNNGNDASIKTSQWLLLLHRDTHDITTTRLYDLQNDPEELVDVSKHHKDVVDTLTSLYEAKTTHSNTK